MEFKVSLYPIYFLHKEKVMASNAATEQQEKPSTQERAVKSWFGYLINCDFIFIYHVALTKRQQRDLFGRRVKLPPAPLLTTHSGGFTVSLFIYDCQAWKL